MATVRAQGWRLACGLLAAAALTGAGDGRAQARDEAAAGIEPEAAPVLLLAPHEPGLRDDVAWLVDRRVLDLSLTTWPLPAALLRDALDRVRRDRLPPAEADALGRIEQAWTRASAPAHGAIRVNSARHPALHDAAVVRGRADATAGLRLGGRRWGAELQLTVIDQPLGHAASKATLAGSYLALALPDAVLAFGEMDRWWGPGRFASPILSDAAPPFPALLLRRSRDTAPGWPALRWLGPWGYELSLGELAHFHPARTRMLGMRAYMRPASGLEIGLSRQIQWAGQGRPQGPSAFLDALLGRSNIDGPADGADPSNELAGLDVRLSGPVGLGTWRAYGHLIGEDEANHTPSRLIGTLGAQIGQPWSDGRLQWTLEATDTQMSRLFGLQGQGHGPAYNHGTYIDGYYHQGLPIGAAIGGGGRLHTVAVDWLPNCGAACRRYTLALFGGRVSEDGDQAINASFGRSGRLAGGALNVQAESASLGWSVGLSVQRYPAGGRPRVGLQGALRIALQDRR